MSRIKRDPLISIFHENWVVRKLRGGGVLYYFNKIGQCAFPLTSPVRGAAAKVVMTGY